MANPAPPLGSQLGQVGINIASFVKDFNLRTSIYKEGVPLPTYVTVNPDRTYNMSISHPPWAYFIKQAAGIQRGAMQGTKQVAGESRTIYYRNCFSKVGLRSKPHQLAAFIQFETLIRSCSLVLALKTGMLKNVQRPNLSCSYVFGCFN